MITLVRQVWQGPRGRKLVADLRHLPVARVAPRTAGAEQVGAVAGVQAYLGTGTPPVVVLVDVDINGPCLRGCRDVPLPLPRTISCPDVLADLALSGGVFRQPAVWGRSTA
jgi:hypothetical protein